MNNSTSTRIANDAIATASSNPSDSSSNTSSNSSASQSNASSNNNSGSSGKLTPQSVGGDQPVGTNNKEVVKENKDVTAR